MSNELQSGGHSKYTLNFHLVWCVKYRHSILTTKIGDRVKDILHDLADEMEVGVSAVETDVDHVHMLIQLKPTHELSKVVQRFKGVTARRIFQEFPGLKNRLWGGHLWSPSYYAATVGGAPLSTIKKYVESQRLSEKPLL
jgi:putative transposase